ncbi:MAG: hypothetical protein WD492_15650 [Alkalispirochaeta sp.]
MAILLVYVVVLSGCSARTRFAVDLDLLSFIPQDEHSRTEKVPAGDGGSYLLLLPYYDQLITDLDTIETELTRGYLLEFPVPETQTEGDLALTFTLDVSLENVGDTGSFDRVEFALFAAPVSAANVYTEGRKVLDFAVTNLEAGTLEERAGTKTLRPGDPGFQLLTTGAVRLGARAYFQGQGQPRIEYVMRELRAGLSVRPFSLFP